MKRGRYQDAEVVRVEKAVLGVFAKSPAATLKEVAALAGCVTSTVYTYCKRFEDQGLLTRGRCLCCGSFARFITARGKRVLAA